MFIYKNHVFFKRPTKKQKDAIDAKMETFQAKRAHLRRLYKLYKAGTITHEEVLAWRKENNY